MSDRPRVSARLRRAVIAHLLDRLDLSFPLDWSPERSVSDVVRGWLQAEARRP